MTISYAPSEGALALLKQAAALGDDGFNRHAIGVNRNSEPTITAAWSEILSNGLVTSKYGGTKEHALVITSAGQQAIKAQI